MIWAKIPPENLKHALLFGYDLIKEGEKYNAYYNPQGEVCFIEKKSPRLQFDNMAEAAQMKAEGIYRVSKNTNDDQS